MKTIVKISCYILIVFCCALSLLLLSPPPEAEAADARGNIYAPDGTKGFLLYSRHKTGNRVYRDGNLLTKDADYELNYQIVRPLYYKTLGGIGTSVQALIPFGDLEVNDVSTSGFMDPTLILAVWPVADRENQFWITIGEWIAMPLGDYDDNRLSLGSNRWGFKTVLGIVKGFGNLYFDIEPSIEFFTDNDDFTNNGQLTNKVSQDMDPLFRLEAHVSYDFTPKFRMSFDYYYENGGEKSYREAMTGLKVKSDEKDNHAAQVSAFMQLAPKHQLVVQYLRDLEVENGFKCDMVGLRYFYIF